MTNEAESIIPYDEIVQDALRAVIGKTLDAIVQNNGDLLGGHHFYISFSTKAAGVEMPENLRKKHPEEITIILENRFSNLAVEKESFSVTLYFGGIPANLTIPYDAVSSFIDPSVDFGLNFKTEVAENDSASSAADLKVISGNPGDNVVSVDFGKSK